MVGGRSGDGTGIGSAPVHGPGVLRLQSVEHPSGAVVLHVSGEIDHETAPELGVEVGSWCDTAPQVLVDLSGVTFLGSAGLSALLVNRDLLDARTTLQLRCGNSRAVRRALQITGTMELFDVVDRVPEDPDPCAPRLFSVPDPR